MGCGLGVGINRIYLRDLIDKELVAYPFGLDRRESAFDGKDLGEMDPLDPGNTKVKDIFFDTLTDGIPNTGPFFDFDFILHGKLNLGLIGRKNFTPAPIPVYSAM